MTGLQAGGQESEMIRKACVAYSLLADAGVKHNTVSETASLHLVMLFAQRCCHGAELQGQVFHYYSEIGCILS